MNVILKISILEKKGSQSALAREIEVCESLISKIVQGRRQPTPEQRQAISKALGAPEHELFPN